MIPIVFIDIDGVLNTPQTWGAWTSLGHPGALEATLVRRMAAFCEQIDARVVLSSTWRISSAGLPGTVAALEAQGWAGARWRLRDCTAFMPHDLRAEEIRDWLVTHKITDTPYVVFDDDIDAEIPQHFVHVNYEMGLSDLDLIHADHILGRQYQQIQTTRQAAQALVEFVASCNPA